MDAKEYIENVYLKAEHNVAKKELTTPPNELTKTIKAIDQIIARAESSKGVMTVFLTSIIYKILHPKVDIRYHQAGIKEGVGYSGRSFDTAIVTPFLKEKEFPNMAESGWLTRSLEQKVPYDLNYTGAIKPNELKDAFLSAIDFVENSKPNERELILSYFLENLIVAREAKVITLATPQTLTIETIINLLKQHFEFNYKERGGARLPVLALYSIYQVLIKETARYAKGYTLLPLESHTSADIRSGRCGDIDVVDEAGESFESVEVKFGIPITTQLVEDCYHKFKGTRMQRYYILSTRPIEESEQSILNNVVANIKKLHGCQVILNGIYPSLKYYLRMISDPALFIENYTDNMQKDKAIKYSHKAMWNELVQSL